MSGPSLAGTVVLAIIILVLIGVGFYNIQSGAKALPRAAELGQEPMWHKQPGILLGLNNIIFALLVGVAALLITLPDQRLPLFILLVLLLLLSIFLVIRTVHSASQTASRLRQKAKDKMS